MTVTCSTGMSSSLAINIAAIVVTPCPLSARGRPSDAVPLCVTTAESGTRSHSDVTRSGKSFVSCDMSAYCRGSLTMAYARVRIRQTKSTSQRWAGLRVRSWGAYRAISNGSRLIGK